MGRASRQLNRLLSGKKKLPDYKHKHGVGREEADALMARQAEERKKKQGDARKDGDGGNGLTKNGRRGGYDDGGWSSRVLDVHTEMVPHSDNPPPKAVMTEDWDGKYR